MRYLGRWVCSRRVTPVAEFIHWFHNYLLMPIITVITLFVLGLLIYVMVQVQRQGQSGPLQDHAQHASSKFCGQSYRSSSWSSSPFPPSGLLYFQRDIPKADMTIKVIGNPSWNWTYEYPDLGINEDGSAKVILHRLSEAQGQARSRRHLAARDRCAGRRAGQQDRQDDHHLRSRRHHPCLDHSVLRHEDRRHTRPPQ